MADVILIRFNRPLQLQRFSVDAGDTRKLWADSKEGRQYVETKDVFKFAGSIISKVCIDELFRGCEFVASYIAEGHSIEEARRLDAEMVTHIADVVAFAKANGICPNWLGSASDFRTISAELVSRAVGDHG